MYLTILIPQKEQSQITLEELLENPFMEVNSTYKDAVRKTTEISEIYSKTLYEKRKPRLDWVDHVSMSLTTAVRTTGVEEHYRHFSIPKKSNPTKRREIYAPDETLGTLQRQYKAYLDSLQVLSHNAAYAYTTGRDIVKANQRHQENNSRWFLQLDLKNFFPSINKEFLLKQLNKVYPFPELDNAFIESLTEFALLNDEMPQGTCLSPILSNLVMVPIDFKIEKYLKEKSGDYFVYTRYADDITISCRRKFSPEKIINAIKEIFTEEEVPFRINEEKTRFGSRAGRNYHLGLIINKDNQISVGHEKNAKFRAMIYQWCKSFITDYQGFQPPEFVDQTNKMLGLIAFYTNVEPDFVKKVLAKYNNKFNIDIIKEARKIV